MTMTVYDALRDGQSLGVIGGRGEKRNGLDVGNGDILDLESVGKFVTWAIY